MPDWHTCIACACTHACLFASCTAQPNYRALLVVNSGQMELYHQAYM